MGTTSLGTARSHDKGRNRDESRVVTVFDPADKLAGTDWHSHIAAVIRVERDVYTRNSKTGLLSHSSETASYVANAPLAATRATEAIWAHWGQRAGLARVGTARPLTITSAPKTRDLCTGSRRQRHWSYQTGAIVRSAPDSINCQPQQRHPAAMTIANNTPFKLIPMPSQVSPPAHSLTVILKGTFVIQNDGVCTVADQQLDFAPDQPYLDEVGRSLAWSSDLVPFKPRTDFYIHGAFHQPDGQPAPTGTASFELGPLKKTLVFHGPRLATLRDGAWIIGEATPVVSVPLRWEYSFGGLSYPANPFGRGIDPVAGKDGNPVVELPLIEHPAHPVRLPTDRPPPANFAPVPVLFQERLRKRGTYDHRWSMFRAPLPPKDYDPSYNNAAPEEGQQAGNSPRGDELLILRHLHPKIPELRTRLPGLRPRVGILRVKADVPNDPARMAQYDRRDVVAEEVIMNLDTVVALPEEDKLVLVWRGVHPMRQSSLSHELAWLQCELDQPGRPPLAFADLEARMKRAYLDLFPPPDESQKAVDEMMKRARDRLAGVDIPADLRKSVENETNPRVMFDRLIDYVNTEVTAIRKRAGLPEI